MYHKKWFTRKWLPTYGACEWFSFMWVWILCLARHDLWENDFVHMVRVNGLSFVWVRTCSVSCDLGENDFLHMVHENGSHSCGEGNDH